jgi:hypothetical protein
VVHGCQLTPSQWRMRPRTPGSVEPTAQTSLSESASIPMMLPRATGIASRWNTPGQAPLAAADARPVRSDDNGEGLAAWPIPITVVTMEATTPAANGTLMPYPSTDSLPSIHTRCGAGRDGRLRQLVDMRLVRVVESMIRPFNDVEAAP